MRKISLWLFIFVFMASLARAQDAATQQQIDKLYGQMQDLIEAQAAQGKRIEVLEKQVSDLGDKLNQPAATGDTASADDLKKLAAQVQEIDKKRQADNDLILKQIEKLGKVSGVSTGHKSSPAISTTTSTDPSTPGASGPQKGYDYTIAANDTVSAIAKAYRAQGVKVTTEQILAANPGLNPNSLVVGKKIFIPDPNAK
ncbi:MAG TPA: LysM peptidoglycan-binding domain-containing protein [Verrucomicrobiae bacterium]|jgi:LysM repeat protein|nr:LysM peptidoglycan-binding domain-containing protein [Verrucomicrobiae bacterium]